MKVLVDLYLLKKIEVHLLYLSKINDYTNKIGCTLSSEVDNKIIEDLKEIKRILNQNDNRKTNVYK